MDALLQSKRKKGRKGDTQIAHLTPGEIVIPRAFAEDYEFRAMLNLFFKENKADLREFIVGDGKNKTNPKTGYLEFDWWSEITKPFKKLWKEAKSWIFPATKVLKIEVPELPSPLPTTVGLSGLAGKVERRRRPRTRRRYTTPGFMAPAMVQRRGLKTTFG